MGELQTSPSNLRKRTKTSGETKAEGVTVKEHGLVYDDVTDSNSSLDEDYNFVHRVQMFVSTFVTKHHDRIKRVTSVLFLVGYFVFLGFALAYDASAARTLAIITIIVVTLVAYVKIRDNFGDAIYSKCMKPCWQPFADRWHAIQW